MNWEDVVAATSNEIERRNDIVGSSINGLTVDESTDEAATGCKVGVVLDLEGLGNLEARGERVSVELAHAGDAAFQQTEDISTRHGDLGDSVAEGEGGKNLATGDVSSIDGGANSARVDEGEVSKAITVVLDGIGHGIAKCALLGLASRLDELNVAETNDLGSEFLEGRTPLLDLPLEFLVLDGSVVQVDRATIVRNGTTLLVKGNINIAQILAPTVRSDNEDFITGGILGDGRIGTLRARAHVAERGMRMAANDQGQACGGLGKNLILVVSNMSQGHDALDTGSSLDLVNGSLNMLDYVEELGARAGS